MSQTEVQLIKDAVIVNADVSNSAAIDVSKISGAMPLTGGTFTNDVIFTGTNANIQFDKTADAIEFLDNAEARFGTGDDLKIFHDGTNSHIKSDTNALIIRSDALRLNNNGNTETMIKADVDGAVELYHNNVKRFETTANGVEVSAGRLDVGSVSLSGGGLALADNDKVIFGSGDDLEIYHDGSHSYIADVGTGELRLRGTTIRLTDHNGTENFANFLDNGAVELFHDNSKKIETASDGIAVSSDNAVVNIVSNATGTSTSFVQFRGYRIVADVGRLGELQFINQRDGDVQAEIEAIANGDTNAYFDFKTNNAGLRTFRVQHDGTHIPDGLFAKFGDSNDMQMGHNTFNYITYTGASFQITGDSTNDIILRPRSNEFSAVFEPNAAVKLYYDNVLKFQTNSLGAKTLGRLEHQSADGNTSFRRDVYYLAIPTQTTKTITLSSLNGTGVFRAGGYTNAGQGALALHILFGGAMFATQHYQVNELINSGMQNTSISTSKNSTNYTIQITNSSTTFSLVLQIYLESTGTTMGYAVA